MQELIFVPVHDGKGDRAHHHWTLAVICSPGRVTLRMPTAADGEGTGGGGGGGAAARGEGEGSEAASSSSAAAVGPSPADVPAPPPRILFLDSSAHPNYPGEVLFEQLREFLEFYSQQALVLLARTSPLTLRPDPLAPDPTHTPEPQQEEGRGDKGSAGPVRFTAASLPSVILRHVPAPAALMIPQHTPKPKPPSNPNPLTLTYPLTLAQPLP